MAMGGPELQTFGFLLRLWSLFVTGGGLIAVFRNCAALALMAVALMTHIAALSLQLAVFSPVICISLLFLTYVFLIECTIRAYVAAITRIAPETNVVIPDDVYCFMGDSNRATQVMAVATRRCWNIHPPASEQQGCPWGGGGAWQGLGWNKGRDKRHASLTRAICRKQTGRIMLGRRSEPLRLLMH